MSPKPHDAAPEQRKFLRRVVSTTSDGVLVYFHLACGHLISVNKNEVEKPSPTQVNCWACRAEAQEAT
jgi:hypothetical protein